MDGNSKLLDFCYRKFLLLNMTARDRLLGQFRITRKESQVEKLSRIVLWTLIFLSAASGASGDVLVTKSGSEYEGKVTKGNGTYKIVCTNGSTLTFPDAVVEEVREGSRTPVPATQPSSTTLPPEGIATSKEKPVAPVATETAQAREIAAKISELEKSIAALPPASPDRPKLAADLMRLRQSYHSIQSEDQASPAKTTAALPEGVSKADVDAARERSLQNLDETIRQTQAALSKLQFDHNSVPASPGSQRAERDRIAQLSDQQIASGIVEQQRRDQAEQAALAAAQAEQAKRMAAIRATTKFPNWHGPWKACPICGGTGRDADAEREENNRNVSIMSSQTIGTGRSGVLRIQMAVIACDLCGGRGEIPDLR